MLLKVLKNMQTKSKKVFLKLQANSFFFLQILGFTIYKQKFAKFLQSFALLESMQIQIFDLSKRPALLSLLQIFLFLLCKKACQKVTFAEQK